MFFSTVLSGNGQAGSHSPLVTFQDAMRHCQTASYLEQHMSHIKPTIKHRGMAAVTHKLFGPPQMNSSLHLERNLIFALALCMFKNDEPMHNHVLQTIYKKLSGTKLDCPRYGNHWELIGFQGMLSITRCVLSTTTFVSMIEEFKWKKSKSKARSAPIEPSQFSWAGWVASPFRWLPAISSTTGCPPFGSPIVLKMSYPRTQHSDPGQGWNLDHALWNPTRYCSYQTTSVNVTSAVCTVA